VALEAPAHAEWLLHLDDLLFIDAPVARDAPDRGVKVHASLADSVFTMAWQPMQTCVGGTIALAARSMFAWQ
jgi:hypothetical protein